MQKKGQGVNLASGPTLLLSIGLAVLIAGAVGISLNSFKETQCQGTNVWSGSECYNSSTLVFRSGTTAANISYLGEQGLNNWSSQISTVGTLLGVALIITVVAGAFVVIGRRGEL